MLGKCSTEFLGHMVEPLWSWIGGQRTALAKEYVSCLFDCTGDVCLDMLLQPLPACRIPVGFFQLSPNWQKSKWINWHINAHTIFFDQDQYGSQPAATAQWILQCKGDSALKACPNHPGSKEEQQISKQHFLLISLVESCKLHRLFITTEWTWS